MKTRYGIAALAVLVVISLSAFGQSSSGSFSGQVTGTNGQGMANVTVRLDPEGGSPGKTAVTGPEGKFSIPNIDPGNYTVSIESAGKRWQESGKVTIAAAGTSTVNLSFAESSTQTADSAQVEIKAEAPTIQTESAQVSRAYDTGLVRSLPLFDRQYQQLIGLMPGVTPPAVSEDRIEDPQATRSFNVNGLPAYANAYFQDGSYQVEAFNARPSRIASNESIQQMNILTSNYNGEYGFSGGSWVNTVTRPGTNGLHGSLFWLNTNRFFATRNPLNSTDSTPGFNRNQFGASAGGPIVKDKTFFFAGYEGMIQRGESLQLVSVPSAEFRAGNFSSVTGGGIYNPNTGTVTGAGRVLFPGGQVPASAINRTSAALLNQLPLPNQPGFANNLVGGAALLQDVHRFDGKLDHRFSENSTGFFRYGMTHSDINRGSLLGVLGDSAQAALRNHNAVASLTQSFTTHLAGEFRAGYSRYRNLIQPWGDSTALNEALTAQGFAGGLPFISVAGFGAFGLPGNYPSKQVNNTWDFATNWNWHNGRNHLKFGFQAIYIGANGFDAGPFSPRGSFFFGPGATSTPTAINVTDQTGANAFASFLVGAPTVSGAGSFAQTPTYRQGYLSGYVTDTINLSEKLYFELGVRYDVFSPLRTRLAGGAVTYDPATNQVTPSGSNGVDDFLNAKYDLNNIAPRVGVVFRPASKFAIRAGY